MKHELSYAAHKTLTRVAAAESTGWYLKHVDARELSFKFSSLARVPSRTLTKGKQKSGLPKEGKLQAMTGR
eukprot:jgi/Chlat1/5840/Chrsp4S06227